MFVVSQKEYLYIATASARNAGEVCNKLQYVVHTGLETNESVV